MVDNALRSETSVFYAGWCFAAAIEKRQIGKEGGQDHPGRPPFYVYRDKVTKRSSIMLAKCVVPNLK